jgi:hypothetical protein
MSGFLRRLFGFRKVRAPLPPAHVIVANWHGARVVVELPRDFNPNYREMVERSVGEWLAGEVAVLLLYPGCKLTVYEMKP